MDKWDNKIVGCYVTFDEIVNKPRYIDALQELSDKSGIIMKIHH